MRRIQLADEDRAGVELPISLDFSVAFTTHADLREFAVSAIAAAVLARATAARG